MTDDRLKKIFSDDPDIINSIKDREILDLNNKIKEVDSRIDTKVTELKSELQQNIETIELQIPEKGDKGDDGKDYVLTEQDKLEIAQGIEVPIVEKIVEKRTEVIHETPIITEVVKEIAISDKPEVTAEKLNTLENVLDVKVLKDHKNLLDKKTFDDFQNKVYTKGQIDMRWHGGGLSSVSHDATLTGNGTPSDPLSVVTTVDGLQSINADTTANQILNTGTSGTDFAISDNGTGTHTFNLPVASATNTGKLSSTDWSTFNNKVPTSTTISTTAPLSGGGDLSANRTITTSMATNRLVGRTTASTGVMEEILTSSAFSLSSLTLDLVLVDGGTW